IRSYRIAREWVRRASGEVLARAAGGAPPDWTAFRIARRGNRLEAFGGGERLLTCLLGPGGAGGLSIRAEGSGARLRNLVLRASRDPAAGSSFHPVFRKEASMADWASPAGEWAARGPSSPGLFWNRIPFFGDIRAEFEKPLEGRASFAWIMSGDGDAGTRGYEVSLSAARVEIRRDGTLVAGADRTGDFPERFVAEKAGAWILAGDGRTVSCAWFDPEPLGGRRLGIRVPAEPPPAFERVSIAAANFINESFENPSPDWREGEGVWGMSTRWRCDPSWSWFAGRSDRLAALWFKRPIRGDFVLDAYAAFAMRWTHPPLYEDPSQMNLALSSDGVHPGRGYAFLYGDDRGRRTTLRRNGDVVAETREHLPPALTGGFPPFEGLGGLHRHWFRLTLERQGGLLTYSVEGVPVFRYHDPDPIPADRLGFWTVNQGLLLARVRLSFEGLGDAPDPIRTEPPGGPAPPETPVVRIESPTHPSAWADFESGFDGFESLGTRHDALLSRVPRGKGFALRATNPGPGGRFGTAWPLGGLDGRIASHLSFAFRAEKGTKTDLRVRANGRTFSWRMTDSTEPALDTEVLGRLDVADDGAWRNVSLDLRAPVSAALGGVAPVFEEIAFGHFGDFDLLNAGIGGNPAGAAYELDDAVLAGPGRAKAVFVVDPRSPWACAGVALDGRSDTIPPAPDKGGVARIEGEVRGRAFLHAALYGPKGERLSVVHRPIESDAEGPAVEAAAPANGSRSGETVARIRFRDASGVDPGTIQVLPLSAASTGAKFAPGSAGVEFDPSAAELRVDLQAIGAVPGPDGRMGFSILSAQDVLGNPLEKPVSFAWTFDPAADKRPPDVRIEGLPPDPIGEGASVAEGSRVTPVVDSEKGACVEIRHVLAGGRFGIVLPAAPFHPGKRPWIGFDWKCDPGALIDLRASSANASWLFALSDPEGVTSEGERVPVEVPGEAGTWQTVGIPIGRRISEAFERDGAVLPGDFEIRRLSLGDYGWPGSRRGLAYRVAHLRSAPAVRPGQPVPMRIRAHDAGGIAAVEFRWAGPDGKPSGWQASGTDAILAPSGATGLWRLESCAKDRAGNLSKVCAAEIFLDASAPSVEPVVPADGSWFAGGVAEVRIRDDQGLDSGASRLNVGGREFALDDPAIERLADGRMRFRGTRAAPAPFEAADGSEVGFSVVARDWAGHETRKAWKARVDRALDRTPPPPVLPSPVPDSASVLVRMDFENDLGEAGPHGDGDGSARVRRVAGGSSGRFALRVEARAANQTAAVRLLSKPFEVSAYPFLAFDYKAAAGTRFDVLLEVQPIRAGKDAPPEGFRFVNLRLLDPDAKENYPLVGTLEGCAADGRWRHARADLASILKAWMPDAADFRVRNVLLGDWKDPVSKAAGDGYWIDNVVIAKADAWKACAFEWARPDDESGIRRFAVSVDGGKAAETETLSWRPEGLSPGAHKIAVSAEDLAGNKGEAGEAAMEVAP
ncbi:MAG: hypothetical protein AAB215_03600, partial [Planctomycetota bacterium]